MDIFYTISAMSVSDKIVYMFVFGGLDDLHLIKFLILRVLTTVVLT